jgi:hypothetical protein
MAAHYAELGLVLVIIGRVRFFLIFFKRILFNLLGAKLIILKVKF